MWLWGLEGENWCTYLSSQDQLIQTNTIYSNGALVGSFPLLCYPSMRSPCTNRPYFFITAHIALVAPLI